MSRHLIWVSLAVVKLFVLALVGLAVPLDFAFSLLFGWLIYLGRVVPRVTIDWIGVATAALCLALFLAGSHAFLRWLHGQVRAGADPGDSATRWRPRWTASMVGLIVLMFIAGLSATGVAHQIGWLLTSEEPLVKSSGSQAARRAQSVNNLKQIGLGLTNYHEAHATFPPGGTFNLQGQPLHGWQAKLLPYIEHQDLYNQIDFAIPWDHPRNRPAFQTDVWKYLNPAIPERKDAEGYALSHYTGNARLLGGDRPRTRDEVTDGTSNTIMAGEVASDFMPWGSPTNWRDPALGINRSPKGFGSPFPGGANVLFVDGSVHFLKDSIDPRVLRSLSTPAGGETISPNQY